MVIAHRPIRIAVAPDSFKGTLTSPQAAACIVRGLRRVLPAASFITIPMADGGEGTCEALIAATGGRRLSCSARNPMGRRVRTTFGITGDGHTAIVEMASASGLLRVPAAQRNPWITSTAGTGDLIRAALDRGVRRLLIGIGGSATNDAGMGMARALGVRFLDSAGQEIGEGGGALGRLHHIDMHGLDARVRKVRVDVACDVRNPLVGPRGASRVYGPQKGASPAMAMKLDRNLRHFAAIVARDVGVSIAQRPGAGAAGGLGGGLFAFLGGRLRPGVQLVADCLDLPRLLQGCALVITGEGRMDAQTAQGKTPAGVARIAQRLGIPTIAICGACDESDRTIQRLGFEACFACVNRAMSDAELRRGAAARLTETAERVGRVLAIGIGVER